MDAQELRNLQEAYMNVYENEQLDEVLDTPERAIEYGKKSLGSILGATVKGLITKDKKYAKTVEKRLEGVERAKRKAERKAAEEMKEGKVPWNDPKKPLESGHTPAEKNRAKRERTGVEDLSKSPTDKEYASWYIIRNEQLSNNVDPKLVAKGRQLGWLSPATIDLGYEGWKLDDETKETWRGIADII